MEEKYIYISSINHYANIFSNIEEMNITKYIESLKIKSFLTLKEFKEYLNKTRLGRLYRYNDFKEYTSWLCELPSCYCQNGCRFETKELVMVAPQEHCQLCGLKRITEWGKSNEK